MSRDDHNAGETSVTAEPAPPDSELPLLMALVVKAMVARLTELAGTAGSGLTVVHALAMRHVAEHREVTTTELAAHLRVTKQSASEIVALLEGNGFVHRRPHPADRRARVVELTDEGAAGLARSRGRWRALVEEWQDLVGAEELATVRRVLEAYLEANPEVV